MASSSPAIQVVEHQHIELSDHDLKRSTTPHPIPNIQKASSLPPNPNPTVAVDKTLSSTTNLAQLLHTGTVLAFEALSSSFTNNGSCCVSNKYLTALLIYFCVLSCIVLTFTNSLMGQDSKFYYSLATFQGFYVINFSGSDNEATNTFRNLYKLVIRTIDLVHTFFATIVFLSVAFSGTSVQSCFFPDANHNSEELLLNLTRSCLLVQLCLPHLPNHTQGHQLHQYHSPVLID